MGLKEEYAGLVDGVLKRLESLRDSGLREVPLKRSTPSLQQGPGIDDGGPGGGRSGLEGLRAGVSACVRCPLREAGAMPVPGSGAPGSAVMFIRGKPGDRDPSGEGPFRGREWELLEKIMRAMKLGKGDVYLSSVVRCRPLGERDPVDEEVSDCLPHLEREIELVGPRVIVTLGEFAANALLESGSPISGLRGRFHGFMGVKVMPTHCLATLLSNEGLKRDTWEDMQKVMAFLKTGSRRR